MIWLNRCIFIESNSNILTINELVSRLSLINEYGSFSLLHPANMYPDLAQKKALQHNYQSLGFHLVLSVQIPYNVFPCGSRVTVCFQEHGAEPITTESQANIRI